MPTFTPQDFDRIRDAMRTTIATHRVPGLSVGLVVDDTLVFADSAGYADIESKQPLTPEHGQRIASITKTMVGLCAMALVDEGKLRLDARIVDLLPEVVFDGPSHEITLRHLLTHTSGIGEAPTIERLKDVATPNRAAVPSVAEFNDLYPDGVVVEVPAGVKWAYCNNGYALLGEIVRRAEGNHELQDIMQRRIWGPLGMRETHILDEPHERLATGYHRAPGEDTRFQLSRAGIPFKDEPTVDGLNIRGAFTPDFNRAMRAAGGVQSTIPDMSRYATALLDHANHRSTTIVAEDTFAAMTAPAWCPDERLPHWGLAFSRSTRYGHTTFGHGGAYFGGWNSRIDVFAEPGFAVLQHMNIMLDDPSPVFRSIYRAVLGQSPKSYEARAVDAQVLDQAPGEYWLPMPGALTNFRPATRIGPISIAREGDGLILTSRWGSWKAGVPLIPAQDNDPAFFAINREGDDAELLSFKLDDTGKIVGLHCDDLVRYEKRDRDA